MSDSINWTESDESEEDMSFSLEEEEAEGDEDDGSNLSFSGEETLDAPADDVIVIQLRDTSHADGMEGQPSSDEESFLSSVHGDSAVSALPINVEPDTNSLMEDTRMTEMSHEDDFNCTSFIARLLCWPIMIPVLFISLFVFIFFFSVPAALFVIGLTCLYYCCTRDPIPPRVLWAAMWQDEFGMSSEGEGAGDRNVYTAEQLKSMCMRRTLLKRIPLNDPSYRVIDDDEIFMVHTSHETLIFSAPLSDDDLGTKLHDVDTPTGHSSKPRLPNEESECIDVELGEQKKKNDDFIAKSSGHSRKRDESEGILQTDTPKQQMTADESEWAREAACDICLLEYEPGETVAWSNNPACSHGYHEDCVADWLVRNLSCPSCRQDFVRADDLRKEMKRQSA